MESIIIIAVMVLLFYYMIIKPGKEKNNRTTRENLENSPITAKLKSWIHSEFMEPKSQTLEHLKYGYYASIDVQLDGILLSIGKYAGVDSDGIPQTKYIDKGFLHFSSMGYNNLPNRKMAGVLKQILIDEVKKSSLVTVNKYGGIHFDSANLSDW